MHSFDLAPTAVILKTDGTNCDEEMAHAFEVAGAVTETVHVNELRDGTKTLGNYAIVGLPGGFSYGDDIRSGKVLANELTSVLSDQLQETLDRERPIIGVCNGFQVLVHTGLLPKRELGKQSVALKDNEQGRFECRWINLTVPDNNCRFVQRDDFKELPLPMQIAHGEGRFVAPPDALQELHNNLQVVFRYVRPNLFRPKGFPDNPNGSMDDIAGICDDSGLILGMMPHPERSISAFHPDRTQTAAARHAANIIFKNIVTFAKE